MLHSDYPLQALLYSVVLHRFLRWRLPAYAPEKHLGGVMYLFLRGMCGPDTPVVDGHPAGVFSWRPPASLIVAMSDLLDGAGGRVTTMEWRQARGATGLLRAFSEAEVLESSDVHVAQRLTALAKEPDETVALAVALAVRALRNGSVCVDLRSVETQVGVDGLPWPDVDGWLAAVRASTLAGTPPMLRLDGDLLYLDRYWLEEQQVADDVHTMIAVKPEKVSPDIDRLFPAGFEEQRAAAKVALSQGLTVLTGGPGTGKTTTVARLLALLAAGHAGCGSHWRRRRARRRPGCRRRCSWRSTSWTRPTRRRCRACTRRRCTGCSGAGRTRRRGSGTTEATGCRTT